MNRAGNLPPSSRWFLGSSRSRGRNSPARAVCKLCNKVAHRNFTTHTAKFKNNSRRRAGLLRLVRFRIKLGDCFATLRQIGYSAWNHCPKHLPIAAMPLGIRPINDFAFKKTFGTAENRIALISLLNAILRPKSPIVEDTYNVRESELRFGQHAGLLVVLALARS